MTAATETASRVEYLLVVGSGREWYRRYSLASLVESGRRVFLLSDVPPTWENEYIDASLVVDLSSPASVVQALESETWVSQLGGIFTYDETRVTLTAHLADALGLPYWSVEQAEWLRSKKSMRARLHDEGVPVPRQVPYSGDLRHDVSIIGLPGVLKPSAGLMSLEVIKLSGANDISDLQRYLDSRGGRPPEGLGSEYIVEQYIEGPEYSIELLLFDGEAVFESITQKVKGPEPYFEEIGHTVPARLPDSTASALRTTRLQAVRAMEVRNGAVHCELRFNGREAVVMEIAGRLGGDKIPYLVKLALGLDITAAAAEIALSKRPTIRFTRNRSASIGFFVPLGRQSVGRVPDGTPPVPGLLEFDFWGRPGQEVGPPPEYFFCRLGCAIAVGQTPEASESAIDQAVDWTSDQCGVELLRVFSSGSR